MLLKPEVEGQSPKTYGHDGVGYRQMFSTTSLFHQYLYQFVLALNISGYTTLGVKPSGASTNRSCLHVTRDRVTYNYSKVQLTMVKTLDGCRKQSCLPSSKAVDINHEKTIEDENYEKDNIYVPTNETSDNTQTNIFDSCKSVLISPFGKWKVTTVNNEKTDYISSFSITGNASKLHQTYDDNNTKVSVQLSQSTLLSPLNFPNTNLGLKYKTDQNSNKSKNNTFHQLIRTTSNLSYEIRELAKKMDTMDQRLTDTIVNTASCTVRENNDLSYESFWDLPLTTIENLVLFEEKLSDNLFRKKVINQLSRYERSTIAETTRQLTSMIFHNNLLSQFSYHGQKHKRVFSVLIMCYYLNNKFKSLFL
ncbi:hypothetical protein AGLY_013458 [Aphis glycines]|uniref:DUF4806 domain-containing protein n=1 Tax=Aphis glycines TaxID=307491 RepID=A0A6G0T6Q6_APHGL|nr:hypothetical protein AGLY_013458 [Aphis glycines]